MRVRADMPPGHVRTPCYLRGKVGWVERSLGAFPNPEQRAYGHAAEKQTLMRIRFPMAAVWGTATRSPTDTIDAEMYQHWLEPVEAPDAP